MRRSHLIVLASVSFAALVSAATTSQAVVTPKMSFGLLKPTEQWKVGTVQAKDAAYCAMVSRFDKEVVLAFARDTQGNSSVAMDFREQFFAPGAEYEVTLKTEGAKTRSFTARASSERSVVVQVGRDEAFMKALGADNALAIGMPTIDVSFALRKFGPSYRSLVNCADEIGVQAPPAVKVRQVEEEVLTPVDREVALLAGETSGASSGAAQEQETSGFSEIETQLDHEVMAEAQKSADQIVWLDSQHAALSAQIADGKAKVEQMAAAETADGKRKLLASIGGKAPLPAVETGAVSRVLERQQANKVEAEALKRTVAAKEAEIAALSRSQSRMAEQAMADFARQRAEMDKLAEKLTLESASLREQKESLSSDNKSLKADIIAKQAALARIESARAADTEALTKKLAMVHEEYGQKIATLEAERDSLKQKLDGALALNEKLQADKLALAADGQKNVDKLQEKVAFYEQEKTTLTSRLSVAEKQNLLLEAALEAKQQEMAQNEGAGKSLAAVSTELAKLKAAHAATVERLQEQVLEKTAQSDALKKDNESLKATVASAGTALQAEKVAVVEDLEAHKTEVARLEEQLKQVELQKLAEAERAAKLQAELEQSRAQIAEIRNTLDGEHARLAAMQAEMDRQKNELIAAKEIKQETKALEEVAVAAIPVPVPAPKPVAVDVPVVASIPTLKATPTPGQEQEVEALAAAEPSSGVEMEGTEISKAEISGADDIFWFESPPEEKKQASAPVVEAAPQVAAIQPAAVMPAPVVKATPVVQKTAVKELAPKAEPRRAAALLDRVMAFHRPAGSKPSAVAAAAVAKQPVNMPSVQNAVTPARAARIPLVAPAVKEVPVLPAQAVREPLVVPAPVVATLPPQKQEKPEIESNVVPVVALSVPDRIGNLSAIESAAGNFDVRPVDQFTGRKTVKARVALEALLDKAGLSAVHYIPVAVSSGEVVKQWSSGSVNGMFEQVPVAGASFEGAVHAYIERYQDDCPGQLATSFGDERTVAAGQLSVVDISCGMADNSYATSFLFLGDDNVLTAILHTAYPAEAPRLKSISDNIAYALESTGGVTASVMPVSQPQPAGFVMAPALDDEFETVIVQ